MLEVARVDRDDGRLAAILRERPDWTKVREAAARHGVFGLLHARLKEAGGGLVPPEEAARIGAIFAANGRGNLLLTAQLLGLLRAFEARGIVAVPIKGPALAEAAYGDVAMRQFADLDILVRKRDVPAAREVLLGRGFASRSGMTERQERAHLARTCELSFHLPGRPLFIDLHWRFAADYLAPAVDTAAVFGRAVEGRLQGRAIRALSPGDLLLFLCLHGTFHLFDTVGLVSDVARLVRSRDDWDWPGLFARAREYRLSRMLLLGLALARDLLGADLPRDATLRAERDPAVGRLVGAVRRELFRGGDRRDPGFRKTARFQLAARDGLSDRLSYCAIRAFSPTLQDWQLVRLPDRLYFLYYLVRPLRLAGLGGALRAGDPANG